MALHFAIERREKRERPVSTDMYSSAASSRDAGIAYHLIPQPVWDQFRDREFYEPEAYSEDGFIHLTLGLDPLVDVANMFYTGDNRNYSVLVLDLSKVQAPVRYEDPDETYPHVYGLLNTSAVIGQLPLLRDEDGTFLGVESV